MKRRFAWLPVLALLFLFDSARAAEYLFVFQPGSNASVYDAATLELLGTPAVGPGAVHAIGIPNRLAAGELREIYIIRNDSVVILDPAPPFAVRRTVNLLGTINRGENSALLTPDGRLLMLLTSNDLQFLDVLTVSPNTILVPMGGRVLDATILPDSRLVHVLTENTKSVGTVLLTQTPPQRLAGPLPLPELPTALHMPPNGTSLYAASSNSLFEISPDNKEIRRTVALPGGSAASMVFDPEPEIDTAFVNLGGVVTPVDLVRRKAGNSIAAPAGDILEIATPGLDRLYLRTAQSLFRVAPSAGTVTALLDPRTGQPFLLPPVDLEIGPREEDLFIAFGTAGGIGSVAKLSANGAFFKGSVTPPEAPTGIALVATPGASASRIEIFGGNHQILLETGFLPSPLAVRVLDANGNPVPRAEVTFSSLEASTVVNPASALTNGNGVAITFVNTLVSTPFQVTARIAGTNRTVVFDVNRGALGEEGLTKVSGDYQVVLGTTALEFPLRVRAIAANLPVPDLELTFEDINSNVVCDPTKITDANGEAEFDCTAPVVPLNRWLQVRMSDEFDRVLTDPFNITAVPTPQELPVLIRRRSQRRVTAVGGETVPDAIVLDVFDTNGLLVRRAGVRFEVEGDLTVNPALAVVGDGGALADMTFGCTLGDGRLLAKVNAPGDLQEEILFTTVKGPPALFEKTQGDFQTGNAGQLLNGFGQPLIAVVTDSCGHPLGSQVVTWAVEPAGAATVETAFPRSNGNGQIYAAIRLGSTPGPIDVTARVGAVSTVFRLFISAAPSQMLVLTGDRQTVPVGQAAGLPYVVQLRDADGNPSPASSVEFRVLKGAAALSAESVPTDAQGQASVAITAGTLPGLVEIEARAGGLSRVIQLTVVGRTPAAAKTGFVNAGSYVEGWVPGSAGAIFGTGLSEVTGVVQSSVFPFPLELAGVKVWVNGIPAPVLAVANVNGVEQVNIQVPFETPAPSNSVTVIIENNGTRTTVTGIRTFVVQPGIFELILGEGRFAAALHLDSSLVDAAHPARPGETISIFLTGLGVTNPPVRTNESGPTPAPVTVVSPTVSVAGQNAEVKGSAYAPGLATAYQINLVIPGGVPEGNLTIVVSANGVSSQEAAIPVAP